MRRLETLPPSLEQLQQVLRQFLPPVTSPVLPELPSREQPQDIPVVFSKI